MDTHYIINKLEKRFDGLLMQPHWVKFISSIRGESSKRNTIEKMHDFICI